MTTDTIDALWNRVADFPCFWDAAERDKDLQQREEQRAVLGRLLDSYLDAGMEEEAGAIRRIIDAPRTGAAQWVFVHFWLRHDGEWRLNGHSLVFDRFDGYPPPRATPRELFESLLAEDRKDD